MQCTSLWVPYTPHYASWGNKVSQPEQHLQGLPFVQGYPETIDIRYRMASKNTQAGWSEERKSGVNFRFRISLAVSTIYFVVGYHFFPFQLPVMDSVVERVIFTLRWQLLGGLTLLMGIRGVNEIRKQSEATADPVKGNAEHLTRTSRNILQNTLEQFNFHFVGQIVLCTYLSSESMKAIPLLVVLFVVARIVYKIGYQIEAMERAYGFIATFIPTVATYAYCLYCMVVYGPGYGFGK
ncbi:transmembrane protein 79-like [Pecten maximus]|uniref:transmembrane protein 79-like n=1 Tax=Pecten maximus TaxID=6579 RepID=UPI001458B21E|nr:transmembrane protein 79-like [Pecten maximus]